MTRSTNIWSIICIRFSETVSVWYTLGGSNNRPVANRHPHALQSFSKFEKHQKTNWRSKFIELSNQFIVIGNRTSQIITDWYNMSISYAYVVSAIFWISICFFCVLCLKRRCGNGEYEANICNLTALLSNKHESVIEGIIKLICQYYMDYA